MGFLTKPITPLLAADAIIELADYPGRPIVLIERLNPPFGWAIPGGFVDVGETLEQAAVREAKEETGLEVKLKTLLGIYSNPQRDPRGHTVTAVYIAEADGTPIAVLKSTEYQILILTRVRLSIRQTRPYRHLRLERANPSPNYQTRQSYILGSYCYRMGSICY